MINQEDLKKIFSKNKERYISELKEYIAFKSVSTDDEFIADCQDCAEWLAKHLENIGLNVELLEPERYPIVYADYIVDSSLPTILLYGHYDVQPADIEDGWKSDPFTMQIDGEDFYARGAGDNKGQSFFVIKALENLIQKKELNVNIKLIFEGQEESKSEVLINAVEKLANKLAADCLVICDSLMFNEQQPGVAIGMRGVFALNVRLDGAASDLHSGHFGGLVKNPATEITKLLASLYKADGSIAVQDYYIDALEISEEEKQTLQKLPSADAIGKSIGMKISGTEAGFLPLESNFYRPTVEINGVRSGYNGKGSKTVIPSFATANISGRTVANQRSRDCMNKIQQHLEQHCPKDLKISFYDLAVGCNAARVNQDAKGKDLASQILSEMFKTDCIQYSASASIPVVPHLLEKICPNGFVTGFALDSDGWHAANEKFNFKRMEHGFVFINRFLTEYPEWHAKQQ